ncbi:MAG: glycosyltransferase family 9 protein [Candidatus Gastranaerophilales bacterium]
MNDFKNILTINFGGIGDEIFFLPTIISLKKEFANAKITLALEPRSKSITDLSGQIDDIILIDVKGKQKYFQLLKLIFSARKGNKYGKFDAVISSGGNKLISILLFLTGIKSRYGFDTGKLSKILLTKTAKLNKNQYACAMYHDLATLITNHKTELPKIDTTPQNKTPNSVLIHPGVSLMSVNKGMIKTISAKTWAKLIDLLIEQGKTVTLAGGPDDKNVIEEIRTSVTNNNFNDLYGKTKSLKDLAELISSTEIFICSDSAPLHIAVALQTKTFAIFGPTDDKKLIPNSVLIKAIKACDTCPIKPCLWEHRQTTCEALDCLKITAEEIANQID